MTISGLSDFEDKTMTTGNIWTFVGINKNTDPFAVDMAICKEPEIVLLKFNVNVDYTTMKDAKFKVEEMYGTRLLLPVTGARCALEGDTDGNWGCDDAGHGKEVCYPDGFRNEKFHPLQSKCHWFDELVWNCHIFGHS